MAQICILNYCPDFFLFNGRVAFHFINVPNFFALSSTDGHLGCFQILATVNNAAMPVATAWMVLESIMLSEVNQSEKDKYHMISPYVESNEQNKQTIKRETGS